MKCECGSLKLVLKWVGEYGAGLECHDCLKMHDVALDPCLRDYRPGGDARVDLREEMT